MMLIPQPPNFGVAENLTQSVVKANYFPNARDSPNFSVAASVPPHHSPPTGLPGCPQPQALGDRSMFAARMQSDVSGFNMYAAATGPPGPGTLPSPAGYGAGANPSHGFVTPHYGSSGMEHSPYYSSLGPTGYDVKPTATGDVWAAAGYGQSAPPYYQYDNFGAQYPYDGRYCGMDMNDGVRRKNATRESTNTLKAWLQEHKKNPYPTKGEKIMLAIITKMTLTQVSTWFANARRRLKKENKMTWVPKNRTNDSSNSSEDRRESEDKELDEKLDEDCQSDADGNDHSLSSVKSDNADMENKSSCQFTENPTSLNYQDSDSANDSGRANISDATDNSGFPAAVPHINGPDLANRLRHDGNNINGQYDQENEGANGHHRSIWSPIDNGETQTRLSYREYGENSQGVFPHSSSGSRPAQSIGLNIHSHRTSQHTDSVSGTMHHQASQNFLSLQPQTLSTSTAQHRYATANVSGSPGNVSSHAADSERRNDCRFTSPVTNLQNWVNGVFHGPSGETQNTPSVSSCQKTEAGENKLDEATDLSSGPSRPDFHYPPHNYEKSCSLSDAKREQFAPHSAHPDINYPVNDFYHENSRVPKPHPSMINQSSSPFYQQGLEGDPSSIPGKNPTENNSLVLGQRVASPKSCSLSSMEDHGNMRMSYYNAAMAGGSNGLENNGSLPPPPYIGQYQTDQYNDRHHAIQLEHGYMGHRRYISPPPHQHVPLQQTNSAQSTSHITSPNAAIGSSTNESSTVEYKAPTSMD